MKFNIVFGGKAGQGPNILSEVVAEGLMEKGYYVFYSRDYQSLIRGGHNFNALAFSDSPVYSNSSEIDILVCLDENTERLHRKNLKKNGIILNGEHENMFFAGVLYKLLGLELSILERNLKKLKNFDENIREARRGYNSEKNDKRKLELQLPTGEKKEKISFMNGSRAVALSSLKSGLEFYYAYPMTPATPLMMELGQMQLDKENKHKVIELENEIACINAALGSSIIGSKSMVGTAGGGFDLMTEALSMSGMAEIPIVIYLAQRPGPSTGVATYTSQGDMKVALNGGHGEFSRVVIAPGNPVEAMNATSEAFYLSQKFRIPAIILTDKHLGESKFTFSENSETSSLIKNEKSINSPERFNSYESDASKDMIATDDINVINENFENRMKKQKEIEKEAGKFEMFRVHGNFNSKNVILGWGSTKGAILDALSELSENRVDAKFIQIIYLEPFSNEIKEEIRKAKKVIVIENNASSPLSRLIAEKTGFFVDDKNKIQKNKDFSDSQKQKFFKILKYDGRPFYSDELAAEIKQRLR